MFGVFLSKLKDNWMNINFNNDLKDKYKIMINCIRKLEKRMDEFYYSKKWSHT